MKKQSNRVILAFCYILLNLALNSCIDDWGSDQFPFLKGEVEIPTETICGDPTVVPINTENGNQVGKIEIYNDLENFYISVFANGNWFLQSTNLYVGDEANIPLTSNSQVDISNFPYKYSHSPLIENHLIEIPLDDIEDCSTLALHVDVVELDDNGNVLDESTGWLQGDAIAEGISRSKYQHCLGECIVKYPIDAIATFAFEDLAPSKGDADYNDFVVQMNSKEFYQGNKIQKIEMEFLAKAKGAGYDHTFLMNVPFEGKASVTIERFESANPENLISTQKYEVDGKNSLLLTIFPSTTDALTSNTNDQRVNTKPNTDLIDFKLVNVSIQISEGQLLMDAPYDPILKILDTENEVHILELTQKIDADGDGRQDYWEDENGIHPFGIVMHNAWLWPLEKVYIKEVYPKYQFVIEDGVFKPADPKWYESPEIGSSYFQPELFN